MSYRHVSGTPPGDWYVELNGELPMPDYRWEDELDGQDPDDRPDMMPSVDALFDPPAGE